MADQTTKGSSVVVESVYLPAGGFVAIHEGSASGPVIGSSKYLKAGTHTDVKITLDEPYEDPQTVTLVAMPHKDTDGDKVYDFPDNDGPYTDNGSAVIDPASVTVDRSTPTPRVVTVEQDSPTPKVQTKVVEETRVVEQTRVVEKTVVVTQSPGQPGFGIAVAVVALLAAALLAVRRRD
ncbi:MAG: PGF-CTERM sorting domain-containing protein [Halobacteriales archaeon]|nr:PGF-CTERM sorting domain-containing protein [Halobacteriales archaeon]